MNGVVATVTSLLDGSMRGWNLGLRLADLEWRLDISCRREDFAVRFSDMIARVSEDAGTLPLAESRPKLRQDILK